MNGLLKFITCGSVDDFKEGKFVIVVDDEDRENEGDLIIAAEKTLIKISLLNLFEMKPIFLIL